jgi:putative transcriptional regulator
MQIMNDVEKSLERGGFEHCRCEGCFDIAARRDFTIFLKVLNNVDSIQESQANNLKIISKGFDAAVAVVGLRTRRESLRDNVVYERFDIPTFTPPTLENIIANDRLPYIYRRRGGFFAEIDPARLKAGRQKAGLSQAGLADRVGVTKKNIYEHERAR